MKKLIETVLDRTGYGYLEPTEQNLISVFIEYTQHGVFSNLDEEEAQDMINDGELTIKMICVNLLSVR